MSLKPKIRLSDCTQSGWISEFLYFKNTVYSYHPCVHPCWHMLTVSPRVSRSSVNLGCLCHCWKPCFTSFFLSYCFCDNGLSIFTLCRVRLQLFGVFCYRWLSECCLTRFSVCVIRIHIGLCDRPVERQVIVPSTADLSEHP